MQRRDPKIPIAMLGLLLTISCPTRAHDTGLSVAQLTSAGDHLAVQVNFARRDIEPLVSIDTDRDGVVSAEEFAAARPHLEILARDTLAISRDSQRLIAHVSAVTRDASDGLRFRLTYEGALASRIEVSAPIIARLARGHRQYLAVLDQQGNRISEQVLAAGSRQVLEAPSDSLLVTAFESLKQGVWHIWIGFDHILFLLALLLPAVMWRDGGRWRPIESIRTMLTNVLGIVTAFTLAHSITLSAAVLGWVALPPSRWVESAIAATVVMVAINNLYPLIEGPRWSIAFGLGLVHGFGFASILIDLGLPTEARAVNLAGFNLGVEAGQLAIVAGFLPLAYLLRRSWFYQRAALQLGSLAIAAISIGWLLERGLEWPLMPL